MDDVSESLYKFFKINYKYKKAVEDSKDVSDLIAINNKHKEAKKAVRRSFVNVLAEINSMSDQWSDDALGEAISPIKSEIESWNLDNIKPKHASEWFSLFSERLSELEELGNNLNGSRPRQKQIRNIASKPMGDDLKRP
jgi:hypothetical protein